MDEQATRPRWPIGLIALLGFADLPRWLQVYVADIVDAPSRKGHVYLFFAIATLVQIATIALAGFLADRFGGRRLMTIGLVAWALCLAVIAVAPNDVVTVASRYAATLAVALVYGASVVCMKRPFANERRARAMMMLNLASLVWLLGVPWLHRAFVPDLSGPVAGGLAFVGALIGGAWWLAADRPGARTAQLIEPDEPPRRGRDVADAVAFFRRGRTWVLVLVTTGYGLSYLTLYHIVPAFLQNMQLMPFETEVATLAPALVVYVVTMGITAQLSDRQVARTGRIGTSRGPFIVAGAAVAAAVGVLPFAAGPGQVALLCLVAFGQAMLSLVLPLYLDIVPAAMIGRFSGLASAFTLTAATALFLAEGVVAGMTHSYAVYFYGAAVILVGTALLAWRQLPQLEPMEEAPGRAAEISAVFS